MRASGMRQYSEIRAGKGLPTSEDEYFIAAMNYVDSITDCDLPRLREAADKVGVAPNPTVIATMAAKLGCSKKIAHEMWMRFGVHRGFASLLRGIGTGGSSPRKAEGLLIPTVVSTALDWSRWWLGSEVGGFCRLRDTE